MSDIMHALFGKQRPKPFRPPTRPPYFAPFGMDWRYSKKTGKWFLVEQTFNAGGGGGD